MGDASLFVWWLHSNVNFKLYIREARLIISRRINNEPLMIFDETSIAESERYIYVGTLQASWRRPSKNVLRFTSKADDIHTSSPNLIFLSKKEIAGEKKWSWKMRNSIFIICQQQASSIHPRCLWITTRVKKAYLHTWPSPATQLSLSLSTGRLFRMMKQILIFMSCAYVHDEEYMRELYVEVYGEEAGCRWLERERERCVLF